MSRSSASASSITRLERRTPVQGQPRQAAGPTSSSPAASPFQRPLFGSYQEQSPMNLTNSIKIAIRALTANKLRASLTMLLGAIAGISLLVGGIGIMNIMLVSVTERTREIGIRKAVGARYRDILTQFVVEAIVVSVLGGLIGMLIGIGISQLMNGINFNGQRLETVVSASSVLLAFGVSAGIGLFFGIYPATRAAALNPIQALRYE
ncbi:MAG: FtsX-like permease family protein [Chloroflexi bacterium]|nr:FtsX-like permease family protein [Chloroflexota bacterium]